MKATGERKKSSKQVSQFLVNDFAITSTDSHVQVANEPKQELAACCLRQSPKRRANKEKSHEKLLVVALLSKY